MKEKSHSNVAFVRQSLQQKGNLNTHISSVHEGKKSFKCVICGSCFTKKQGLIKHIASMHEGKKSIQIYTKISYKWTHSYS